MPAKAVIFAFCLVVTVTFAVFLIDLTVPLSKKPEFDLLCSEYLTKMEVMNGLPYSEKLNLKAKLEQAGFQNVYITGTLSAKKGESLTLFVSVRFPYYRITGLFTGESKYLEYVYEKSTVARKIYN